MPGARKGYTFVAFCYEPHSLLLLRIPYLPQSVSLTVLSLLAVLVFVWVKQERVKKAPESVDQDTAQMAAAVKELSTVRSVTQRILLSYASVLGSVGDLKAKGPALLRDVTGLAEVGSGGVSMGVYFIKCALGWDFYGRLWGGMLTPVFLATLSALYTLTRRLRSNKIQFFSIEYFVGCTVMIVFLTFSSQMKSLLQGWLHFVTNKETSNIFLLVLQFSIALAP